MTENQTVLQLLQEIRSLERRVSQLESQEIAVKNSWAWVFSGFKQTLYANRGFWIFGDVLSDGRVPDHSQCGNHLVPTNVVYGSNWRVIWAGLNGSNAYLTAPDSASLDITTSMTMGCWVNISATGASKGIMTKYTGGGNQRSYGLLLQSNNLDFFISSDGTTGSICNFTNFVPGGYLGGWHFIVAVFASSTYQRIYIDGTLVAEKTSGVPSGIFNGTAPFQIGAYEAGAQSTLLHGNIAFPFICVTARPELVQPLYYLSRPCFY